MSYASNVIGLAVTAFLLLLPPLVWHSRSRNVSAVILILWLLIMDLKSIVDASIWSGDNFREVWEGKGWCDIMVKLQMGANVGISCAVTNVIYNLHEVLKADSILPNWNSWRKLTRDVSFSLVTPICVMGLSYLIQVRRYGLSRYNGCINLLSPTWVTTVLYTIWMFIWSLVGTVYAFLVLYVFYKKRKDVKDILHCTNSGLNVTRFARLLIFCLLIILVMFPFSLYSFVQDLSSVQGRYSFKETHPKVTWNIIPKLNPGAPFYNTWLYIAMSYLVFILFGLGSDALKMYSSILYSLKLGFIVEIFSRLIDKEDHNDRVNDMMNKLTSVEKIHSYDNSNSTPIESANDFVDYGASELESFSHIKEFNKLHEIGLESEDEFSFVPANINPNRFKNQTKDFSKSASSSDEVFNDDDETFYKPEQLQTEDCSIQDSINNDDLAVTDSNSELNFHYKIESKTKRSI